MGACCFAGAKGKRYALPNSRIMVHQPSGGAQGQATEISPGPRILTLRKRLEQIYVRHTAQPIEAIKPSWSADSYLSAEEARDFGLVERGGGKPSGRRGRRQQGLTGKGLTDRPVPSARQGPHASSQMKARCSVRRGPFPAPESLAGNRYPWSAQRRP